MNSIRQRPNWVDEEPVIQDVLNHFLDQIDRNARTQFKINNKTTPELFDHIDDDPQYLWHLLKTLDNEYHVLSINKQRSRAGQRSYENAQLSLNPEKEALVRSWLNRPAFDPYTLTWKNGFEKIEHLFEDGGRALQQPLRVEGKSADEVLKGFAALANEITKTQTLRNLSAKCFWGDSKFLDGKLDLISELFPHASHNILPRPILMNIALNDDFNEIIFVENQDTFLMLQCLSERDHRFSRTAFVYSSGFKGTSRTVRKRGHVLFSSCQATNASTRHRFEQWWHDKTLATTPCYFWGDLDYAGMAILKSLRQSFENIRAWQLGYELMMQFHSDGHGHKIRDSKKMKQLDPGTTGCALADDVLLPMIRSTQRFLDQEVIASRDFSAL